MQTPDSPLSIFRVNRTALLLAAALLTGGVADGRAALIAADSFLSGTTPSAGEYRSTGQLQVVHASAGAQNPTVPGFSGAWAGNSSNGTVAQWTAETTSVTSTLPYVTGGRARFEGVDNLQRRVQRQLAAYTASDVYYMSFLMTAALDEAGDDGFVGIGFTGPATGTTVGDNRLVLGSAGSDALRGLVVGYRANADNTTDLVVRHRGRLSDGVSFGAIDNVIASNIISAGPDGQGVYNIVLKLETNSNDGNPTGNDRITAWVNPATLFSEAAATAATTPTTFFSFTMGTTADLTQLTMSGLDYSKAASFDEVRLGTEWADVVPEPASLALLGLGTLLTVSRRRP